MFRGSRALAFLAGISLTFTLLVAPNQLAASAAKAKAGATCSKLNQTQVVGSLKFTCIKSGKKLIWNKGVKIKTTPTPSPTPTPPQTPTPTPTPVSSASPTASPTASPGVSPTPSPSNLAKEGWLCDPTIALVGKDESGKTFECVKGSDGKSSWRPPVPSPTPSQSATPAPSQSTSTPSPSNSPSATNSPSPTPSPKIALYAPCDPNTQNVGITAEGIEVLCKLASSGLYIWEKPETPKPSPSPSQSPVNRIALYGVCDPNVLKEAVTPEGVEVLCKLASSGAYIWEKREIPTPTPSPSSSATPSPSSSSGSQGSSTNQYQWPLPPLGKACTEEGKLGWNGSIVAICKSGKVKYATPNDLPKPVASGVTKKPDWYPTITQIITGDSVEPTCPASSIKLTKSIFPVDQIAPTIPYGMMVYDHVTPIDHAYISLKVAYKPLSQRTEADYVPISTPADGTIVSIGSLGSTTSHRVVIDHGCGVFSVFMVVNRFAGPLADLQKAVDAGQVLNPKIAVKAGDVFGLQRDNPLDYNIFDGSKWLSGFANPAAYLTGDTFKPYTADYLDYFTAELRPYYENTLQRTTAPRIGKIDYDAMGGAAGNWFIKDHFGYGCNPNSAYETATALFYGTLDTSKQTYAWCHLAIAPHEVDTSAWIFSTGWWKDPKGDPKQFLIDVDSAKITPDQITEKSGTVIYKLTFMAFNEPEGSPIRPEGGTAPYAIGYKLYKPSTQQLAGYLAIQIRSDGTMAIDVFTDSAPPTGMTANPRVYSR